MDRIFANASTVLVWLGPEDENKPAAVEEFFVRMDSHCRKSEPTSKGDYITSDRFVVNMSRTFYNTDEV